MPNDETIYNGDVIATGLTLDEARQSVDYEMRGVLDAEVKATDTTVGEWEAVISAPTLDRDGEVIAKGAFNPLPKSIPIHLDHNMTTDGVVGIGRPYYAGDELRLKGTYASTPKAQIIRQLVAEGVIGAMSVGFMDAKRVVKDGVPTITKAELLEASFVTVPSNREALVVAAKSFDDGNVAEFLTVAAAAAKVAAGDEEKSTAVADPEDEAAAPAAAEPPADTTAVALARLAAMRAEADLLLLD